MCIQVQANLSMAELEASDANTKYWLQTQNTGRTIGESCGEKYGSSRMIYIIKDSQQVLKAYMNTRPVHKNLFLEFPKNPGSFRLHFDRQTNVTLGVLLKYRSFIKFWEPPILQGRIHGTKLP